MKIFEIKIYPFTEEEFYNKKSKFIESYNNKNKNVGFGSRNYFYDLFYADKLTFYNYSIGFVEIHLVDDNIRFEVYLMQSEKCASRRILKEIMDKLNPEEYPDYDSKLDKAKHIAGYKKVPYIPKLLTEKKHYMIQNNFYNEFNIQFLNNAQIVNSIKEKIIEISKFEKYKKLYFDMKMFNSIADFIDFEEISKFEKEESIKELFNL